MSSHWNTLMHPSSPIAEDGQAITEELRMLVRSGRFRDCWYLSPAEAFARLGFAGSIRWRDVAWYGPLEIWRDPEHAVSDILFNGPPDSPFSLSNAA